MARLVYQVRENDNVGTALESLERGEYNVWLENVGIIGTLLVLSNVPQLFKVALKDVAKGQHIIKFGYPIGTATVNIQKGMIVHRGNLVFSDHEKIMLNPSFITNRFEIGDTRRLIKKGQTVKSSRIEGKVGKGKWTALTNIAPGSTLYCGNLLEEGERYKIDPKKLERMKERFARYVKKQKDPDFRVFLTDYYPIIRFYDKFRFDLSLREISESKGC